MRNRTKLAAAATILCGLTTVVVAQSLSSSKRSEYTAEILKTERTKDGRVEITFRTMPESVWHCPGANGKRTKERIELTFVRAWYKKKPKVDYPATVEEDGFTRSIVVDAKDKPIFMKSGKKLVQIFPPKGNN